MRRSPTCRDPAPTAWPASSAPATLSVAERWRDWVRRATICGRDGAADRASATGLARSLSAAICGAGLLGGALSCGEADGFPTPPVDFPLRATTPYYEVYAPEDVPICAGTLAHLDRRYELGIERFGAPATGDHYKVYVGFDSSAWLETEDGPMCSKTSSCFRGDYRSAFTTPWALEHEFNHLMLDAAVDDGTLTYLSEGMADALNGEWSGGHALGRTGSLGIPLRSHPFADPAGFSPDGRGYDLPAHLTRWWLDTYGWDSVRDLYVGGAEIRKESKTSAAPLHRLMEQLSGSTIAELELQYRTTAPLIQPRYGRCDRPTDLVIDGPGAIMDVTLDCDAEDTWAPYGMEPRAMVRDIVIDVPNEVVLRVESSWGVSEFIPCLDTPVTTPELLQRYTRLLESNGPWGGYQWGPEGAPQEGWKPSGSDTKSLTSFYTRGPVIPGRYTLRVLAPVGVTSTSKVNITVVNGSSSCGPLP